MRDSSDRVFHVSTVKMRVYPISERLHSGATQTHLLGFSPARVCNRCTHDKNLTTSTTDDVKVYENILRRTGVTSEEGAGGRASRKLCSLYNFCMSRVHIFHIISTRRTLLQIVFCSRILALIITVGRSYEYIKNTV